MDPTMDETVDNATLPKGRDLPTLILFDKSAATLKKVMQLSISTFVEENESLIICTTDRLHKEVLEGQIEKKECRILYHRSLSGIESQWVIVTAHDQHWRYEVLSRARNGLVILLDTSADDWYVFLCCCYVSSA